MHKTANGLLRAVAAGGLMLGLSQNAQALVVTNADFDFASGAEFTGQISFSDDFSTVLAVSGILTGYQNAVTGFTGIGSTAINALFLGGADFNPLPNQVTTLLTNTVGGPFGFTNFITLAYDLSSAPNILLAPGGPGLGFVVNVNFNDVLVEGSLTPIPVPPSALLFLSGLAGIGVIGRSRKSFR